MSASNRRKRPRVIVCGSRDWKNPNGARKAIADRLSDCDVESIIVHGASRGVDRFAHQEAEKLGLLVEPHPYQDFIEEGHSPKVAPLARNVHMASLGADRCIAFWNGRSTGTQHMLLQARLYGIPTEEIEVADV